MRNTQSARQAQRSKPSWKPATSLQLSYHPTYNYTIVLPDFLIVLLYYLSCLIAQPSLVLFSSCWARITGKLSKALLSSSSSHGLSAYQHSCTDVHTDISISSKKKLKPVTYLVACLCYYSIPTAADLGERSSRRKNSSFIRLFPLKALFSLILFASSLLQVQDQQ